VLSSQGPDTAQFDVEISTADDEVVPCRDHMAALPYEGEAFEGSVGILRNIAAERERERELHRFQRMVETAGEAICALDDEGRVTYANEAFLDLLGVDEAAIVGEPYMAPLV
jgi:PAS domain-containing protein